MIVVFYLGTHQPQWLGLTDVPLFVSHRRLAGRKTLPRARGPWALDSGGFSELSMFGEWRTTAWEYAWAVRRYMTEIGGLMWAAIQDWMCEPFIVEKTGLSIVEHQRRTIASYLQLRRIWRTQGILRAAALGRAGLSEPWLADPFVPVLQGFARDDYHRHADDYAAAGVDLAALPVVGVGSICRRQGTDQAARILRSIAIRGIRIHAFGLKTLGLRKVGAFIESSDSMAWSFAARRDKPLPGCVGHRNCANCIRYALAWRERVVGERQPSPAQLSMFPGAA